jgi:hypothetical protein
VVSFTFRLFYRRRNSIVTYSINALPSNGSVNNLNNREIVFDGIRAATAVMQRRGKYASTTIETLFRGVRAAALQEERIGTRVEEKYGRDSLGTRTRGRQC